MIFIDHKHTEQSFMWGFGLIKDHPSKVFMNKDGSSNYLNDNILFLLVMQISKKSHFLLWIQMTVIKGMLYWFIYDWNMVQNIFLKLIMII